MSAPSPGGPIGVLRLLVGIALFRSGPQDLPVSRALLLWCILGGVAARTLALHLLSSQLQNDLLAILAVEAGATLLFVALVLAGAHRPERFLQTAGAVFGVQLVMLPLLAGVAWLLDTHQADPFWRGPSTVLYIAANVWLLAVEARILRAATDWTLMACVGLAILSDLVIYSLIALLFPMSSPLPAQA